MIVIIKNDFSREDLNCGATLVTPQSFSRIKSWKDVTVSGEAYYVKKAVSLGAAEKKEKVSTKKKKAPYGSDIKGG
jgi:hypothetical protein